MNLPGTIRLPSGRSVRVNSLPWKGYKLLRSQLMSSLSGDLGDALSSIVGAWDALAREGIAITLPTVLAKSNLTSRISELLVDLESRIEDLADNLVASCCPDFDADGVDARGNPVSVFDVLTLRRHVLDSINLAELLDAEKNLFRGIFDSVKTLAFGEPNSTGTTPTSTADAAGGPDSSQ